MSDDSKLDFILDLDGQSFISTAQSALEKIEGLGSAIESIGTLVGFAGAAFLVAKAALDLTFEAESIKSVNAQFDILARNAGLVPDQLKAGLNKAADGLIQDTDLLQLANEGMVRLGSSSGKLVGIMDVARKASIISGRDITQVFQQITEAVSSGQTRQLKTLGIFVDSEQAIRKFAAANGLAVNELSEAGRRQAIINAALADASKRYKDTDKSIRVTTDAWTQFKVAMSEAGEVISTVFGNTLGPRLATFFGLLKSNLVDMKTWLEATFGTGAKQAEANTALLNARIAETNQKISDIEQHKGFGATLTTGEARIQLELLNKELENYKKKLGDVSAAPKAEQKTTKTETGGTDGDPDDKRNKDATLRNTAAFNREIASLGQQRLQAEEANAQSIEQVDANAVQQRIIIQQEADAKISEIRNNPNLRDNQKNQQILLTAQIAADKQLAIEDDLEKKKTEALDRYASRAKSEADGIARAFEAGSKKAQIAQQNFGATGARVFASFEKNAVSALEAFGAGQESASEAAKGFIFGMLADEAEARGKIIMLASIWPPNPAGFAAGAGLIALAGFLRSQASTSGSVGGSADAGSAGSASSGGLSSGSDVSSFQQQQPQKAVTINIEGNYFETDQTKQRLVEMINETQDATGYTVRRV